MANASVFENKSASAKGRVDDPDLMWFSDQIALFDSYVVPLSSRIDDCDVFYKEENEYFVDLAMNNRSQWMNEGPDIIEKMINEWDCYIAEYFVDLAMNNRSQWMNEGPDIIEK